MSEAELVHHMGLVLACLRCAVVEGLEEHNQDPAESDGE